MAHSCVSSVSHADTESQAMGIRNLGNTCYFSAVMQSLLRTHLLLEELQPPHQHHSHQHQMNDRHDHQRDQQQKEDDGSSQAPLTKVFLRFAEYGYRQQSEEVLNQLLNAFQLQSTRFSGGRQNDSHDCFIHFLNDLRDEERRCCPSSTADPKKCLTAVDKVFGGHLVTDYFCLLCGDQHRSCEPLLTISLPVVGSKEERSLKDICKTSLKDSQLKREIEGKIKDTTRPLALPNKTSQRKFHRIKTSVKSCFRHFTRFEKIDDEYLCQKCQKNEGESSGEPKLTSAIKCTQIYNPPAVLVLHMKRFEQVLGRFRKRSENVRYKEVLDLGPYCISSCNRINPGDQNVWYSLFAVIVHQGSLTRGHYVAYFKEGRSGVEDAKSFLQTTYLDRDAEPTKKESVQKEEEKPSTKREQETPDPSPTGNWFYVSDQNVRRLKNSKEALNKEAYLLFYERIGTPFQTTEEKTEF